MIFSFLINFMFKFAIKLEKFSYISFSSKFKEGYVLENIARVDDRAYPKLSAL